MPTRPSLAAGCGATFLLFISAACSGGANGSPAGVQGSPLAAGATATPAGQAQGQQGGAGSVDDGIGHPVNICTLLPVATVASVTGEALSVATEEDTLSYKIYVCNYTSADGTSGLTVNVLAMDAAVGYDANVDAINQVPAAGGATQISGLGDKAYSGPLGLEALFGNVSITVTGLQSDAAAETLIRDLQPKL